MVPHLILVDGMTGSGKSTTAQKLSFHLRSLGHDAVWYYEHDTNHPVWPSGESPSLAGGPSVILRRWHSFTATATATATARASDRITLMESAFLTTAGYQLAQNIPVKEIMDYMSEAESAIAPLNPVAIYFRAGNVADALARVCEDRRSDDYEAALITYTAQTPYGQTHGVTAIADVVTFLQSWQELVDALFSRLKIRKLVVENPAKNWRNTERILTDFLGLPEMPKDLLHSPSLGSTSRFKGMYQDSTSTDILTVAADEQGLYLEDARGTRLFHRTENRFEIQSMNVEVVFEDAESGVFKCLRLCGNLPGMSPMWHRVAS